MKNSILLISILLFTFSCVGMKGMKKHKWDLKDTGRQVAGLGLLYVDYKQSVWMSENNHIELNPFLDGESPDKIAQYFLFCAVVHTIISYFLKDKYREYWQLSLIGLQGGVVLSNKRKEIKAR